MIKPKVKSLFQSSSYANTVPNSINAVPGPFSRTIAARAQGSLPSWEPRLPTSSLLNDPGPGRRSLPPPSSKSSRLRLLLFRMEERMDYQYGRKKFGTDLAIIQVQIQKL